MNTQTIVIEQKETAKEIIKSIEEKVQNLALETDNLKKSEFFKNYLDTMSKFWKYSLHNQMLIFFQRENSSKVAGFKTWLQLKRYVKSGEKAIKILAPFVKKITVENAETKEKQEKQFLYFVPVNVFDISQTEGQELPHIEIDLSGDNYGQFLITLEKFCESKAIKVEYKDIGINGLYGFSKIGAIVIAKDQSVNTKVNTLLHEIAHELLHKKEDRKELSKQQMEIQAEGVAYVVMKHFGLESNSFNYLALYDADYKKILSNLCAIAQGAKEVIEFLNDFFS